MRFITLPLMAVALMGASPLQFHGWVNDFAEVIPDDREVVLEQKLDQFEKKTTVEIAVVTTSSLDGEDIESWTTRLFRQWGVGKAENDNGLMVVVAPNEHRYRIEVGYGLEPFITDAYAGELGRETLPDAFRQNDYAGGLDHLTDGLIQKIGNLSPRERQQYIIAKNNEAAREAKHAAERKAMFWEWIGNLVAGGFFLGGSVFGFVVIRRRWRSFRARQHLQKTIRDCIEVLDRSHTEEENKLSLCVHTQTDRIPAWLVDDVVRHEEKASALVSTLYDEIRDIRKMRDHSDEELADKKTKLEELEQKQAALVEHRVFLENIPETIENTRKQASDRAAEASEEVTTLNLFADSLSEKGFSFSRVYTRASRNEIATKLGELKTLLANRQEGKGDASKDIIEASQALIALAKDQATRLTLVTTRLTNIEELYSRLERRIGTCREKLPSLKEKVELLRQALTPEQCSQIEAAWHNAQQIENLHASFTAITMDTKMQADKQGTLQKVLESISDSVSVVEEACRQIGAMADQYDHAKSGGYEEALGRAGTAIRGAMEVLEHDDAGKAARSTLNRAQAMKTQAVRFAHDSKPDWIGAMAMLGTAIELAGNAKRDARRNIESANQARARAAQRRQDDERRRRQRRDDDSGGFGGGSFSSSSGSSGGGFGGFGGGSSGGGGASGSW